MEQQEEARTWSLISELLVLFVGLPLLMYWELIPIPKILLLLIVAGYCGYQLWRDPTFGRGLLTRDPARDVSKDLLIRTMVIIVGLSALVWTLYPDQLFAFPAERPIVWMVVMVLYPILSALPQEFIYRTYFFHRFGNLLSLRYSDIILSALGFSFLHIIYDNWWAVGLSFVAGLLFGITYSKTKSLFWVTVEHALYGWIVFTLGMGNYFYEAF